ncbi:hypothetical protein SETIT_5G264600v2 [Setaria italica]|uniref:GOLD domain-containing protein n=1 Tax=Setaria italica TaxID=4555 RepID=A0A368R907_SETIT|nr:hypothetical protein SETIT_5G264600v2 [Setaria italica]
MAARRPGSPASMWPRPSALLLLVAFALLSAPRPARALRFDLESGHTKCISDEIKLPESHRISLRVTSPYGNSMHYAEHVQSGHFAFTATEAGDYLGCGMQDRRRGHLNQVGGPVGGWGTRKNETGRRGLFWKWGEGRRKNETGRRAGR